MSIQLIIGLGNPGKQYVDTRHNAGAWWVEKLANDANAILKLQAKFNAYIADTNINGQKIVLAIPTTYMNESGNAVQKIAKFYKINPENILIAHDELDLEPGVIRLKQGGGHGGHNGLRDIIPKLGSSDFVRLRVGIGHPGNKGQVSNYVLNAPSKDEMIEILSACDRALYQLNDIVTGNIAAAMNNLH